MTMRNTTLPAFAAALLLSGAGVALAAPSANQPPSNTASLNGASEAASEHQSPAEIQAFQQVKIPISQAIQAAEQQNNGKAIDASFEVKNGKPVYRVKTWQNNSVWEGTVDANSGRVAGQGQTTPESKLDQEDKAEINALMNTNTSLMDAARTAEQQSNAKVIDAGLEARNGNTSYEIQVLKNGNLQTMNVNPQTGQLASNQQFNGQGAAFGNTGAAPNQPSTQNNQQNTSAYNNPRGGANASSSQDQNEK